METKTIALCFLTQRHLRQFSRWETYRSSPKFLFYIHNSRNLTKLQADWGDRVTNVVSTNYVEIEMVDAEAELYRSALLDVSNFAFVLLSESTIPLMEPDDLYKQISEMLDPSLFEQKENFMGICATQNDELTRLTPFIGNNQQLFESMAKHYEIPIHGINDEYITAILPSKILTVAGATEFVHMRDDVSFMVLFETRYHFTDNIGLHTEKDILRPYSSPDEGCFVLWCNYRGSVTNKTFNFIENSFTYWYFDEVKLRMIILQSIGNGQSDEANGHVSISDVCDGQLFARKIDDKTIIPYSGAICQRDTRKLKLLPVNELLAKYVILYFFDGTIPCETGTVTKGLSCKYECSQDKQNASTEKCIDVHGKHYTDNAFNRRIGRVGKRKNVKSSVTNLQSSFDDLNMTERKRRPRKI